MNVARCHLLSVLLCVLVNVCYSLKGANVALTGNAPYYARIEFEQQDKVTGEKTRTKVCGATVVQDDWVLTMASCVQAADAPANPDIKVFHGYGITTVYAVQAMVHAVYYHADYDAQSKKNNIALIKVDMKTDGNRTIAVKLPWQLEEREYNKGTITGTGKSEFKQEESTELRITDVNIPDQDWDCKTIAPGKREEKRMSIKEQRVTTICVGDKGQYPRPCDGDEGGPLVAHRHTGPNTEEYVLIGMIPIHDCSKPIKRGGILYPRIGYHWSWIKGVMDKYSDELFAEEVSTHRLIEVSEQESKPTTVSDQEDGDEDFYDEEEDDD